MTPRVSVIVPNQKSARWVAETIETLIRQTMSQWELIVVDDGSDPDLPETVEGFADRYASGPISLVVVSNKRCPIPALVNSGIRHMSGDYFAWLNPGELLEPQKLELQSRVLDENPQVGLVHSSYVTTDPNGSETGPHHSPDDGSDAFLRLVKGDCINPNTALIRRCTLEEVGPFVETDGTFPELWRAAAYRQTLRIALRSEIGYIDRVLGRSRCWNPDTEYSRLSLGSSLEKGFIADCFEEYAVQATPELVVALFHRGLIGVATRGFRALSVRDQARAIDLVKHPGLDRTWFARHSERWWSPAFSTQVVQPARREWRVVGEESNGLSGATGAVHVRPGTVSSHDPSPTTLRAVELKAEARAGGVLIAEEDEHVLGNPTVERIPKVPDGALQQHLLVEVDGLGKALGTDRLLAARMILDWASNSANFGAGSQIVTETNEFLGESATELYYEHFLPNRGAVYCGGMAVFYDRVLKAFGYDSFTINFGDVRDGLSHVAVSLPICDGATLKHYLFDPTFNTTFHYRAGGCQLDFFELVDAFDAGGLDRIEVRTRSIQGRDWISIGPLMEPFFGLKEVIGDRYVYGRSDGRLTDYLEKCGREFAANGYEPGLAGFVQLMRARMFSLGWCAFVPATDDFANKLQVRGIPFGPP